MPRRLFRSWYPGLILPFILMLGLWFLVGQGSLYQSSYYGKLYGGRLLWLTSGSEVRQDFVANYPGLNQVDVFVKNLNPAISPEITFQLRQTCQAKNDLSRQVVFQPHGQIEGQTFYSFTFDPLEESTAQKYCFILTANTASDEQVIGVLAAEGDVYPFGQAFYQDPLFGKKPNKPQDTPAAQANSQDKFRLFLPIIQVHLSDNKNLDVAFQLHYEGSCVETSQAFFDRLVADKPYWWGRPEFYTLLFAAYIFGATTLIKFVIRQVK